MTLMNAFYQRPVSVLLALLGIATTTQALDPASSPVQITDKSLSLSYSIADPSDLKVYELDSKQPLFGSVYSQTGMPTFVPYVPFVAGTTYRAEVKGPNGAVTEYRVKLGGDEGTPAVVTLSPAATQIPANTLKLYLNFTEPMEQGVFLKFITLYRSADREVTGAFRETELWSPDGKRLTLMLHPGRQKTGVNLNVDEGPVLEAFDSYKLVIDSRWRTTSGVPLPQSYHFYFQATAADHDQPDPMQWQVSPPLIGTHLPLRIITSEVFEPHILQRAIHLQIPGTVHPAFLAANHVVWTFTPEKPWQAGFYEISIDPELEDLSGNSIAKPFEIDVTAPKPASKTTKLTFRVSPP